MLEACQLHKHFSGITVLHDVSFRLLRGEIVGYLGANGSGKSTTVRLLTGLLEPTRGIVTIDGADINRDLEGYRRRLGYVPEEPYVYGFLSGREYLALVARLRQLPPRVVRETVPALLESFGLGHAAEQDMRAYSKGMRQKVLLAAALLHDPDVLILDEPESGLDVSAALVLRHLVRRLADRGKAVLYSSHQLDEVERTCSRVLVLHEGRLVASGTPGELRTVMAQASLEEVFARLAVRGDPERTARDIVDAVSASA